MATLTKNDKGQYVPFRSRALNDPALAKALEGKPLHAMARKSARAALGYSTDAIDQERHVANVKATNRRLRKATKGQRPQYMRIGGRWTRTTRGMCSHSWRH